MSQSSPISVKRISERGNRDLRFARNKAYSFNSTVSIRELQSKVRSGVMEFRQRLIHTQNKEAFANLSLLKSQTLSRVHHAFNRKAIRD